jgi:hypothetical protein
MNPFAGRFRTGVASAAALGIAASSGHPAGMALMCLMPALAMLQANRRDAFVVAASFYAGATWPVIPAAQNFVGPEPPALGAALTWLAASLVLAAPWPAVWTPTRWHLLWRVPLGLAASAVPPLGIIGVASPLSSAGLLFPGAAWLGLAATAILPAACLLAPRTVVLSTVLLAAVSNTAWQLPRASSAWEAVNTNFGAISHGGGTPAAKFATMTWLQARVLESPARVVVFPETVVPTWTDATELFWQQTLAELHASGKTVIIGVGIPTSSSRARVDLSAELAALRGERFAITDPPPSHAPSYLNAALIRGTQSGTFLQRIPVPFGMWRPFNDGGVPLHALGPGVITIAGERVAIWICYEQLLVWPVIESMVERPTVIVAMANDYWVTGTPIPRWQAMAVTAWGRLFGVPRLAAVNH